MQYQRNISPFVFLFVQENLTGQRLIKGYANAEYERVTLQLAANN